MSPPEAPKRLIDERPETSAAGRLLARSLEGPLDDSSAQARIWRGIAHHIDVRPRRVAPWRTPVLAVASLIALLLGVAWWRSGPPPTARLELTAGDVVTSMPEAPWTSAEAGRELSAAARLKTGPRATAVVRLPRSAVALSSEAEVTFESVGASTRLRLASGTVTAEVEPREAGRSFVVETARYQVTVKGTVFSVQERTGGDVVVSVSRGRVEVSGPLGVWEVPAGRSWHSLSPSELVPGEVPSREQSLLALALRQGPRGTVRVEGPVEHISEGGLELGSSPLTWRAPEGLHHLVGITTEGARALDLEAAEGQTHTSTFGPNTAPEPTLRGDPDPAPDPAPEPAMAQPPGPPGRVSPTTEKPRHRERRSSRSPSAKPQLGWESDRALEEAQRRSPQHVAGPTPYESAALLAREGRYEEAAAAFKAIASGKSPYADLALYGLGRIQQIDLGHPKEALVTFDRYRRAYPRGTMIQEVEISTIEIELQRRDFDSALASMNRFLSRYPSSERVGEVRLLRGNVERERGDCAAALDDYELARAGAQEGDALYYTGWCQQKLGQTERARETWREYLARFPSGRHAADAKAALGVSQNRQSP